MTSSFMTNKSRFRARFGDPQATVEGPGRLLVAAELHNRSNRIWEAAGPVRLAYQILDRDTGALLIEGERTSLPADLAPGREGRVAVAVALPQDTGAYRIRISLVEENVAWFFQQGGDSLTVDAEISGNGLAVHGARRSTSDSLTMERVVLTLTRAFVYPARVLWRNRALIVSMVRRDIHGRYRGSMAGLFWTVIHPLLMMLTYFFVFAIVLQVRFGTGPVAAQPTNFLLYFIAGMLPWLAFSEALGRSPGVIIEHRMLVKRVLFPIEILPVNVAAAGLVSEFFGLLVFLAALGILRHSIPATAILLPLIVVPQILLTLGFSWFLAGIGVFLRDTGQFMAFVITLWFFATPICYPESALPERFRWLFEMNPAYVLARCYRTIFLEGQAPPWAALGWLALAGFGAAILGFAWFYKSRKAFPDVL
jgi:lipopolysaccharide transport system permease protein